LVLSPETSQELFDTNWLNCCRGSAVLQVATRSDVPSVTGHCDAERHPFEVDRAPLAGVNVQAWSESPEQVLTTGPAPDTGGNTTGLPNSWTVADASQKEERAHRWKFFILKLTHILFSRRTDLALTTLCRFMLYRSIIWWPINCVSPPLTYGPATA
jgi:hypothetical protein